MDQLVVMFMAFQTCCRKVVAQDPTGGQIIQRQHLTWLKVVSPDFTPQSEADCWPGVHASVSVDTQ